MVAGFLKLIKWLYDMKNLRDTEMYFEIAAKISSKSHYWFLITPARILIEYDTNIWNKYDKNIYDRSMTVYILNRFYKMNVILRNKNQAKRRSTKSIVLLWIISVTLLTCKNHWYIGDNGSSNLFAFTFSAKVPLISIGLSSVV